MCNKSQLRVFEASSSPSPLERRVRNFIELRESNIPETFESYQSKPYQGHSLCAEIKALHEGEYRAQYGYVDLQSAKSLLNRYALSIPRDATSRSSRQAMLLHMPIYDGNRLTLPAHLPSHVRSVTLPEEFRSANKKDVQNMLALMACVRLHDLNLLNDRLLPLKRKDMHDTLLSVALQKLPSAERMKIHESPPSSGETKTVYVYAMTQSGSRFCKHEEVLQNGRRRLGLVTLAPLISIPQLKFHHNELDEVCCTIDSCGVVRINDSEWSEIAMFYTTVMDARWRRRTGRMRFRYKFGKVYNGVLPPYLVVTLTSEGTLDWDRMRRILAEHKRDEKERRDAVKSSKEMNHPRLWVPIYDPNVTYIALGPSQLTCDANFPYDDDYATYADYMQKKRGFGVKSKCPLFAVQRMWLLPRKIYVQGGPFGTALKRKRKLNEIDDFVDEELQEGERAPLDGLGAALLPLDACMEAPVADAALSLQFVLLPQILYNIDRYLTVKAFIDHCKTRIGKLGGYLEQIPLQETLEALTAKSCSMVMSYDRLEYLGDAVLKLTHTDALLHSRDLRKWVAYLHEGDLSTLRSAMGSNDRLKDAAISMEIDKFILTRPLGRGQWVPVGLEMFEVGAVVEQSKELQRSDKDDHTTSNKQTTTSPLAPTETKVQLQDDFIPSNKVCADVIEAVLGLVYLNFGYQASMTVAEEFGISLLTEEERQDFSRSIAMPAKEVTELVESLLGTDSFNRQELLLEALTHPSCIHEEVPCYQRLEWVGDAVLCLAAREWVYHNYPDLKVAELVVVETTLVCNETLAYIGCAKGLHRFINHRDPSLPHRFLDFEHAIEPNGRGLWGTDPPKVLPDVVEALIGAAHVDAGFKKGQSAALHVLQPVIKALIKELDSDDHLVTKTKAREMMHPKQVVHELAGRYLSARSLREDEFAQKYKDCLVWRNNHWGKPNIHGNGAIGQVLCLGLHCLAVAESSAHIAKNRACALAVSFFHRSPELLEDVKRISDVVKGHLKGKDDDEDDDEDDDDDEEM